MVAVVPSKATTSWDIAGNNSVGDVDLYVERRAGGGCREFDGSYSGLRGTFAHSTPEEY